MTLADSYREVMEHITVTAELRGRVLRTVRVRQARRRAARSWLAAAACFLLLLTGALTLPRLLPGRAGEPEVQAPVTDIPECASASELSARMGFPIADLADLSFAPEETSYLDLFGEIAEITYTGAEQRLTLRKSLGSEDNSGDYRGFTAEETAALADGTAVTLKGDGTGFLLALWQRDGYAYSLAAETGMTAEALLTLAASAG